MKCSKCMYDIVGTEYQIPKHLYDDNKYIFVLLTPILLKKTPNNYIVYQFEQTKGQFVNDEYFNLMSKSLFNFDYSRTNIQYFKNKYFLKNIGYQPIFFKNKNYLTTDCDYEYDVLFIGGCVGSERRIKILNNLKIYLKECGHRFYIIDDNNPMFGTEKKEIIKKSKIVINIHYSTSQFETPRICELLEFNKIIISEKSIIYDTEDTMYTNCVFFIDIINDDLSNIHEIQTYLTYFLYEKNFNYYTNYIRNKTKIISEKLKNLSLKQFRKNTFKMILNQSGLNTHINIKPKICILTANLNNYDNWNNNIDTLKYKNIDFYYINDNGVYLLENNTKKFIFKINKFVDNKYLNSFDKYITVKYIKMKIHMNNYFNMYTYIIWMDSSIVLNNVDYFFEEVEKIISLDYDLFLFKHYKFHNIYDEYICASSLKKYQTNTSNMFKQFKTYMNKSDINNCLFESGFIIHKNTVRVNNIFNSWFQHVKQYSVECQLSLSYLINDFENIFIMNDYESKKSILQGNIWKNNLFQVKLNHNIPYLNADLNKKINGIDKIYYINLDRSEQRNQMITSQLKTIDVSFEKISAIDGSDLKKYDIKINSYFRKLSDKQIACTLSHCKAICKMNDEIGDIFLVIEDDCNLYKSFIFEEDLNKIIKDAPLDFDILMLYKTNIDNAFLNKYEYLHNYNLAPGGAVAYIINRNGINKFIKNNYYENNNIMEKFVINDSIDVSDIYIYKDLKTYFYLFNYFEPYEFVISEIGSSDVCLLKSNIYDKLDIKYKYFYEPLDN
jgi:GR25 family glycosyltransferase involved in LPS biosynthesis